MERRVKLCRLTEIVGQITVITLDPGHAILSFLSGCLIPLFLSRLFFFFFFFSLNANLLLCDELIRARKCHMPFNKWKDICFLKRYVIEVSCEYCFVIKLLQTLSCNKVFKCTRKDKKILSVSHVHSYEIVRYRLGQRIERKKVTFMGKRMKSLE